MDVREFVIRLVLDAMGFRQQVESAQKELDEMGRAAEKASQQAESGLDDVAKAAAAAGTDLRDVGQQASRAGEQAAQGAKKGASAWEGFGDVITKVGAFIGGVATVKSAIGNYVTQAAEIANMSQQMGVSMEQWQGWREAAREMGADVEALGGRLQDVGDWAQEFALLGSGPMTDFAEATGESFKDATGKAVGWEEATLRIAGHLEKMGSTHEKQAWLTNIGFDEKQIAMFLEGRKKLEDLIRAKKENALYDKQDGERAKALLMAWNKLNEVWARVSATIVRVLGPVFDKLGTKLDNLQNWVENNGDSVVVWVGALATVFAVGLAPAIWAAMAPLLPFIAAFVLLGATLDDLVVFAEGGQSAIEKLMERMGVSRETIESVRSAVKKCVDFFKDLWAVITGNDNDAAAALERIRAKIEDLKESFKALFVGIGNWIGDLFTKLSKALLDWIPDPLKEFLGLDGEAAASAPQSSYGNQLNMAATGGVGAPASMLPPASPAALGPAGGGAVYNSKAVQNTFSFNGGIHVESNNADPRAVANEIPMAFKDQVAQAQTSYGT